MKEIPGPDGKDAGVANEDLDLFARLVHIQGINRLIQQVKESPRRQRTLALSMAALAHPLLQMLQMKQRMMSQIPHQIVPIRAFDPVFPPAAPPHASFPRTDPAAHRPSPEKPPAATNNAPPWQTPRRIGIHFQLDLEYLSARQISFREFAGFDDQQLLQSIRFQKS